MRCEYCGWENSETNNVCEKCNQPLTSEEQHFSPQATVRENGVNEVSGRKTERKEHTAFSPKATVREQSAHDNGSSLVCPSCGFVLDDNSEFCPSCGGSMHSDTDYKATIRPRRRSRKQQSEVAKVGFHLTPIPDADEVIEIGELDFEGDDTVLNRDNTEPTNTTITTQKQAVITHKENKWFIEDASNMRTTFVQASRAIELQSGDLILLGDRTFRFDPDNGK